MGQSRGVTDKFDWNTGADFACKLCRRDQVVHSAHVRGYLPL